MLLYTAIAPDHPVLIPEIAGESLVQVEESVNAMLKLALKVHADSPDTLIILSPKAPILHKRHSISAGKEYVRTFASNMDQDKVVSLQFQGEETLEEMITQMLSHKVILEGYTQEHGVVAIDDAGLALMYYLHRIESTVKVLVIGVSDMGLEGQMILGSALRDYCTKSDKKYVIAAVGHMEGLAEDSLAQVLSGLQDTKALGGVLLDLEDDLLGSQSTLAFPLMTIAGMYLKESGKWHGLGDESFGQERFITGYIT